jgi:DNA-binding beta-propeller fold protein YncE
MKTLTLIAALGLGTALAGTAQAQTVAALIGDDTLAIVDAGARKVQRTVKITGASGKIVGIDVRPADGMLYAVAEDGTVMTVDAQSGRATTKSKLETMLKPGTMATVDFNPAADRLRIIGSDGMNLRANVDDGKVTTDGALKFAESDTMKGKSPRVVAGAYTNSMKGAKETVLYDIDAAGALLRQAPPNDGVLNTIGMLGMPAERVAFDIAPEAGGGNSAWLMAGPTLYKVDLASGKATEAGRVEGAAEVRDIAVLPSAM